MLKQTTYYLNFSINNFYLQTLQPDRQNRFLAKQHICKPRFVDERFPKPDS